MDVRVVTCWLSRISSITAAIGDELFVFSRLEQRDQCHQMNVNYAVCSIDLWFLLQSSRKLATLHWIARNTHLLRKALMPDSLRQPLHSTWGGRGRNGIRPQWWNPIPIFHSVPLHFVRTSCSSTAAVDMSSRSSVSAVWVSQSSPAPYKLV